MGWEDAAKGFKEIPKGQTVRQIWVNSAIYPLWGVIGVASVVCGGFVVKYFAGHTDIAFSKTLRSTFDSQGLSESRVSSHNSHFGCRELNKKDFSIWPFTWLSMKSIANKHYCGTD